MHANALTVWLPRIFAFVLAAAAAASAAFWALKWSAPTGGVPLAAVDAVPAPQTDMAAIVRALGGSGVGAPTGTAAVPSPGLAASRFVLTGVVAGSSQLGASLIAVDGKPAKPFAVGARVGDEWVLRSVQPRRAVLVRAGASEAQPEPGAPELVLEMPLPSAPKVKTAPGP